MVVNIKAYQDPQHHFIAIYDRWPAFQNWLQTINYHHSTSKEILLHLFFIALHLITGFIFFRKRHVLSAKLYVLSYSGIFVFASTLFFMGNQLNFSSISFMGQEMIILLQRPYLFAFIFIANLISR